MSNNKNSNGNGNSKKIFFHHVLKAISSKQIFLYAYFKIYVITKGVLSDKLIFKTVGNDLESLHL